MMTSDAFSNILSHLMTFHDHMMTFMMRPDLDDNYENLLTTLVTTDDYLVRTHNDDTDDPCDDTDL
jgi:hypothetical protein